MKLNHPTSSLPALKHLPTYSYQTILCALFNLRTLYWSIPSFPIGFTDVSGTSKEIIDSGYASAEEEEGHEQDVHESLEILRNDPFEKKYTVTWLTGFISRSEQWIEAIPNTLSDFEEERDGRVRTVDEAIELLALCADTQADGAMARNFVFSDCHGGSLTVELNDEPYEHDHEGVGLQTWGSASVLAKYICAQPEHYFPALSDPGPFKLLELGAGTGLLSIMVTKLLSNEIIRQKSFNIVASDFHPEVLRNLRRNIIRNLGGLSGEISVENLDWSNPPSRFFGQFDVILAADVIYDQNHGYWIRSCAENLLRRTATSVMWLIIPQRPTRTMEIDGIDSVFHNEKLGILSTQIFPRSSSVGRIDEDGYRLFKIGWTDLQHPLP